jgi:hypothetical protein
MGRHKTVQVMEKNSTEHHRKLFFTFNLHQLEHRAQKIPARKG